MLNKGDKIVFTADFLKSAFLHDHPHLELTTYIRGIEAEKRCAEPAERVPGTYWLYGDVHLSKAGRILIAQARQKEVPA